MMPMAAIDLPPGWEAAGARVLRAHGPVLVLGGPDTGKSTFCRYLLGLAQQAGQPAALLDGDLGQSHLGPPATLGLNFYPPHAPDDAGLFPDALYFIGQTSPPGRILELVVGLRRLAETACSRGSQNLIVNTSGFIGGPGAQRLKLAKTEILQPSLCIGLQHQEELAPILSPLQHWRPEAVITLPVSSQALPKLYPQRRLYRQERFAAYFTSARPRAFPLASMAWMGFPFGQGQPLPPLQLQQLRQLLTTPVLYGEKTLRGAAVVLGSRVTAPELAAAGRELGQEVISWANWGNLEFRLVGLLDEKLLTLALGLLLPSPWERREIIIHTPLPGRLLEQVKFCRLGKIRLDLEGRELPQP